MEPTRRAHMIWRFTVTVLTTAMAASFIAIGLSTPPAAETEPPLASTATGAGNPDQSR